jgi:deoxyhypusine synthase
MTPERKKAHGRNLRTSSLKRRKSKVLRKDLGRTVPPGATFAEWMDSLPDLLAVRSLRELARAIVSAKRRKRRVILGLGAHVVKCGLSPLIVKLMEEGVINAVALNGAGAIHDFELAWGGSTSEDVGPALETGTFGMARETAAFVNGAAGIARSEKLGFGEALGRLALERKLPNLDLSILAAGAKEEVPVTVHVALGTDIVHMHPSASGADIGEASLADFHRLARIVERLEGGVYVNIGSAVILPEVFLKALALARNRRDGKPRRFVTADLDFRSHYRPLQNVVCRPVSRGGKGYQILGHHEINVPLLFAAVREGLKRA